MRRAARAAASVAGLLALGAAGARAEEKAPALVAVALPSCATPPFERVALRELLAIELRSDGVERVVDDPTGAMATLRIEQPACEQPRLVLVLEDRTTGKTVGRSLDLATTEPSARARLVALSSAELLRASWLELLSLRPGAQDPVVQAVRARALSLLPPVPSPASSTPPASSAPPPPVAPPPSDRPSPAVLPASPPERVRWQLGGVARGYPASQASLAGAFVGLDLPLHPALALRLDARGMLGEAFDVLGKVSLRQASLVAALRLQTAPGAVRFGVGPQVELGAGQVEGTEPTAGVTTSSGTRGVFSAALVGEVRGGSLGGMELLGSCEGGVTGVGLTAQADGRRVSGLIGPFLGVSLGAGW